MCPFRPFQKIRLPSSLRTRHLSSNWTHLTIERLTKNFYRAWIHPQIKSDIEHIGLAKAIRNHDLVTVQHLLAAAPQLAQQKDEWDSTPLHHAARADNATIARLLLESGAHLEIEEGWERRTPLEFAVDEGSAHVVQVLLDFNENLINERRVMGNECEPEWIAESLLHCAAASGHAKVVQMVLVKGGEKLSIEERNGVGQTPLLRALWGEPRCDYGTDWDHAKRGRAAMVFVHAGADLSVRDAEGRSVFAGAVRSGCVDLVETLLASGQDVNEASGSFRFTALHLAARGKHLSIAGILLKHGADIDAGDEQGCFPLHLAVPNNTVLSVDEVARSVEMIECLLRHRAWIDAKDNEGETPLHRAVNKLDGCEAVVKKLLEHGAAINTQSSDSVSGTPLHAAVRWEYSGRVCLQLLLAYDGINQNIRDLSGMTPLHRACQEGKVDSAEVLLEHSGVDLEAREMRGRTAIMLAAWAGSRECMMLLEGAGAARDGRDCDGNGLEFYVAIGERKEAEKRERRRRGRSRGGGSMGTRG